MRIKKYAFSLLLCGLSAGQASAQDVLNEILRSADQTVNDTTRSMEARQTALFKFDAMTYMRDKILPAYVMLDKQADPDTINLKIDYLNRQAYAMSVYLSVYRKRLAEASPKNQPLVTRLFRQATIDHKAFDDPDTAFTMAYCDTPGTPVPFCLDCDWVQTLAFIRSIDWRKLFS